MYGIKQYLRELKSQRRVDLCSPKTFSIIIVLVVVGYRGAKKGWCFKNLRGQSYLMQYVFLINLTPFFLKKKSVEKWDRVGQKMAAAVGLYGGSWVKSVVAHFDNLKSLLGSQNALWYWLEVNEGILTVKTKFHVFASLEMMILYVIRGGGWVVNFFHCLYNPTPKTKIWFNLHK